MKYYFFLIYLLSINSCFGQKNDSITEFGFGAFLSEISDTPDLLILGEDHRKNNTLHKYALISYLYENWGLTKIGLEFPRSLERKCNNFVLNGSSFSFKEIEKEYFMNKDDQLNLLKAIRQFNVENDCQIEVCCFDIEPYNGKRALLSITRMLYYHKNPYLNDLIKLCSQDVHDLTELKIAIASIRKELSDNSKYYENILESDFHILEDALIGIEINSLDTKKATNDFFLEEREKYLAMILNKQVNKKDSTKILVFTGNDHANNLRNDSILESNSLSTILRYNYQLAIKSYNTLYFNCRESICEKRYAHLIDFLNIDLNEEFKSTNSDFLMFDKKILSKSPFLFERCDGVIVKNCHGTKRGW